ncbi:hypothetical protein HNQ07_004182 [Deinococcus metalli]|uniref:Universal stress protein n=1 Tax=Deinococcus metalli TaxID=1141878 RepID=A0A7W8KIS6_9DEIO|nr:universal stress protein [Deinococcus metalli]MBB5378675.1 hypothetical protein [Deinococcus metalli]GHF61607.1 hypothetical protein GCM10017781_42220 [Deinococcus metalli]
MIQTLLVPLDDSPASQGALNGALAVAAQRHFTVVGQPISVLKTTEPAGVPADRGEQNDPLLHDFAVRCDAWQVNYQSCTKSDLTSGTLRSALQDSAIDAIWLPQFGSSPERPGRSTLPAALLHASPIMVWVSHPASVPPTHLTVAYDGDPHAQEALMVAASLALNWSLPLHLDLITPHGLPRPGTLDLAATHDRLAVLGRAPTTEQHCVGPAAPHLTRATGPDTLLILGTHWPPAWPWHTATVDSVLGAAGGSVLVCPAPALW